MINGNGFEQASLMIIGDYVRKADVSTGYALSGYYKSKLNEFLKPAGYNVDQTYRTCIIKEYIQGLGVGTWPQDKKLLNYYFENGDITLAEYINIIIEEINTIKPTVILLLGEYALRILTEKEGIGKWRGSVLPLDKSIASRLIDVPHVIKAISTYHPLIVNTIEEYQFIMRLDFKKAVELVFDNNKQIDYHEIFIAKSCPEFIQFLDMYPIEKYHEMTYDIETHYGFITAQGISFDGFRGICIPGIGSSIDLTDRCRMYHLLSIELSKRELINQNITFDKRISQRFNYFLPNIKWDTMLAAHTIAPEFPKRLDFLTSIYTDMSFYKDEGHEFNPKVDSIDKLYGYNVKDAITTFQIYKAQRADLEEMGMLEFFTQFVMKLFNLYYQIDSTGILININKRNELRIKYETLKTIKKLELDLITNSNNYGTINVGSYTQVGKFMETSGFPVLRHRVDSGFMIVNTDSESLQKMRVADISEYKRCNIGYDNALRFINLVLLIRRIDKVLDYIDVGIHPWNRVHTSYKLWGTTSGRTSANQTLDSIPYWVKDKKDRTVLEFKTLGQSFQTVTKHGFIVEDIEDIEDNIIGADVREMYIPDPHFAFVEIDLKGAEARVCEVLGEAYDILATYDKVDPHCNVASMIFPSYSYDQLFALAKIQKNPEGIAMRNIGKHAKHAKNNGMDAYAFAIRYLHMASFRDSINKATTILKRVDKAYPYIENVFHAQVEVALRSTRCLVAPRAYGVLCGRKRMFYKKIEKHYLNVAFSYLPQCTITDHTKAAMLRIYDLIDKTKSWIVAENHDSITSIVHRSYIRKYINIAKQEMERSIDFRDSTLSRDYDLVIPIEIAIGRKNWGSMLEIKKIKL